METLAITVQTKKTCQLINLIATCKGNDISDEIETLMSYGIDCSVQFPESYETGTDCDTDTYDDFITKEHRSYHNHCIGDYLHYPITWAILHHCHENTLRVLFKYTLSNPKKDNILNKLHSLLILKFSQLYRNPYFMHRSSIVGSYHNKLKQQVNKYLDVLNLSARLFETADRFKYVNVRACELCNPDIHGPAVDYQFKYMCQVDF